jgi:hypothetical protein
MLINCRERLSSIRSAGISFLVSVQFTFVFLQQVGTACLVAFSVEEEELRITRAAVRKTVSRLNKR